MLELERLNLNSNYSGSINNKLYYWSKLFNFFEPHVYHMNANISPVFDFLQSFYYWLKICPSDSYVETHSLIVMILRGMTFGKGITGGKALTCQCRRQKRYSSDFGVRKIPREGHGNPLQYSWLENPMDTGAWWATVHRVTKSWTWLKWLSTFRR